MEPATRSAIPSWDFPRAPAATRTLVEVGVERGASPSACLRDTGLTIAGLGDPDAEIEATQELGVARNLVRLLGDQAGIGVEAGLRYTLGNAGILGFALLASPTVRDAAEVGLRYMALTDLFVRLSLEEDGAQGGLLADDAEIPEDVRAILLERDLAAIGQLIPVLLGRPPNEIWSRFELRLDPSRGAALAAALPARGVEFRRDRNMLSFPRRLLDQPLPQADSHTAEICERQCRELLERRQRRRGTAGRVRASLVRTPGRPPSMDEVAAELAIDPRTLRRRLRGEDTSFRALLDEVRETLAVELLDRGGLTVEQVARRLGYAEPASFSRAFKRWRGVPPSEAGSG